MKARLVALAAAVTLAAAAAAASAPATGSRQATDSAQASSKIAFLRRSNVPTSIGGIYVMNADGRGTRLLARNASHVYAWSPDGRKIAFGRGRDGNDDIYVMNADGTGPRNLTHTRNALNQGAVWSPDGPKIAFTRISGSDRRNPRSTS